MLAAYGIPLPPAALAADADGGGRRPRRRSDMPVALKIRSPDITHKSDVGGVALDLGDAGPRCGARPRRCSRASRAPRPEARLDGFLVQQMVAAPGRDRADRRARRRPGVRAGGDVRPGRHRGRVIERHHARAAAAQSARWRARRWRARGCGDSAGLSRPAAGGYRRGRRGADPRRRSWPPTTRRSASSTSIRCSPTPTA